jgi:hypothetical protein
VLTRRPPATIALAVWSLLVWTTRVRNAVHHRTAWRRQVVLALAGWTTVVWAVRATGIATADHDGAFVAVHLVLAAVSIVLAVLAVREQRAQVTGRSG